MRELTKNEKILLGILGIILIGWATYHFIIRPQSQKLQAFSEQKLEYEDKIQEINTIFSQEDEINKDLDRLREEQDQLVSGYFPKLHQAQATYLINDLVTVDEMEIVEMNFDESSYQEFDEFQVKKMDLAISYEGTYDGILGMIRSLKTSPRKIVVNSVSAERNDEGHLEGVIALRIYALDDLVDADGNVIPIHTEKRDIMRTPFSAYSSYKDPNASTGEYDESWNPSNPSDPLNPSEELSPYSPGFSVDYEKENEISIMPNEEVK